MPSAGGRRHGAHLPHPGGRGERLQRDALQLGRAGGLRRVARARGESKIHDDLWVYSAL